MSSSEPLRLTNLLRIFRPDSKKFDFQDELFKRTASLKERQRRGTIGSESTTTFGINYFLAGVGTEDEKKVKLTYSNLLATVKHIIGDEQIQSEVLTDAALRIYNTLANKDKDDEIKKVAIKRFFKHMTDKQFLNAKTFVNDLEQIREKKDKSAALPKLPLKAEEFGNEVKLEFKAFDDAKFEESEFSKSETKAVARNQHSAGIDISFFAKMDMYHGWLEDRCEEWAQLTKSEIPGIHLAESIRSLIESSNLQIQEDLLNILGDNGFDFIRLLVNKRKAIIQAHIDELTAKLAQYQLQPAEFRVQSKNEQKLVKQKEKEIQKLNVVLKKLPEEEPLEEILDAESIIQTVNEGPDMTLNEPGERGEGPGWAQKSVLPEDAIVLEKKTYKEIVIPAKPKPQIKHDDLIPISEFEDYAQLAFKGIKYLNPMQSKVFESAYKSNTNLLICAPTGAGKTNVAMMAILREVGQHYHNGILSVKDFKIIYVAPMKALASEMTSSFGSKLQPLGIIVKELTGDMQLTKKELEETQIIVTTPEKWDVITRKSSDIALTKLVRLLIIDEVHLLNEDRGPVIESLVARTLRQVEQSQSMIRIVGLSATLPNYKDVASFLRVDAKSGLFYFGPEYRPVPLETHFIGIKGKNEVQKRSDMDEVCFSKAKLSVSQGNQVMIFVHSRRDTSLTAEALIDMAKDKNMADVFEPKKEVKQSGEYHRSAALVSKSRNAQLKEIFSSGFGIHHAGMLRQDRNLVEKLFHQGFINVLVCTATLAWGVNLPAHTVMIKGTQIYDPKKGGFVDLGMLDVQQIFGRAGRPQFDDSGEAMIITTEQKLNDYLRLLTHQLPIESQFIGRLADHLNAEIVLGTVSNIKEAIIWLSYTYLYIRMRKNPLAYGSTIAELELDENLLKKRGELIENAAKRLDKCEMIRYDERNGNFSVTDLGRIASHFYIQNETIEHFNKTLHANLLDSAIFDVVSQCAEFENIMLRDDERAELDRLEHPAGPNDPDPCKLRVKGGADNRHGKVNILLQTYISKVPLDSFSLISDTSYVSQNAGRIFRALFEIAIKKGWTMVSKKMLTITLMVEKQMWATEHPLRQFDTLSPLIFEKLEANKLSVDQIREMSANDIAAMVRGRLEAGKTIKKCAFNFPKLEIEPSLSPITKTIIKVTLTIRADFMWSDRFHGNAEPWWLWVEDESGERIYHSEYFILHKKQKDEDLKVTFIMPIFSEDAGALPTQYYLHAVSDRWLGASSVVTISLKDIILPEEQPPHTELLPLRPLPLQVLQNPDFEKLFKFTHFNRIQTQTFFTMYHNDINVLVGAPTGSGKTIVAELAMMRLFRETDLKVVYIGPLKALVRERLKDWQYRYGKLLGKNVIELTGDYTPDMRALQSADLILTTPEKWDGISRNWQQRTYVKKVGLLILDEIHLLGVERGAIIEVIVSRMRYISSQTETPIRFVALSTALANPEDLADWLGIDQSQMALGLFNFHPSVRPVGQRIHIQGFSGKNYCPRMNSMNKPAYSSIILHSPVKPVLIFVSSRRQTRLTALDLISYAAADDNPKQFLKMTEEELEDVLSQIEDPNLQHTIPFGIGLHHAGLKTDDRALVESLFLECKIQILVSTSTLAWGVNLPAHLVIVKGTEFYDPKTRRYVDMPVTDVLQMIGRAGRPQFDKEGVAVVMVEQSKKNFYKKFLFNPFPVESNLKQFLHDHLNAEVASGTISNKQDAVDYIVWTYFFRRLEKNPTFYGLTESNSEEINRFLSDMVDETIQDLELAHCVEVDEDSIIPTTLGRIASYYYLHYTSVELFHARLSNSCSIEDLLNILCDTAEYDDLPVRHNEEVLNQGLADEVRWKVEMSSMDSPHTKANLLLQAHFSGLKFPISDYYTDLKSVLDQSVRILQAMVDVCADSGWLLTTLNCIALMQMIIQGHWHDVSTLAQLGLSEKIIEYLARQGITCLPELLSIRRDDLKNQLSGMLNKQLEQRIWHVLDELPVVDISFTLEDTLVAGSEIELNIDLSRASKYPKKGIHSTKFPKRKEEGWWLVLGDPQNGELLALRRVNFQQKTSTKLTFDVPEEPGQYLYYIYFMSDSYIGLDQQYELNFEVIPESKPQKKSNPPQNQQSEEEEMEDQ